MAPADPVAFKPVDGGWGWVVVFGAHISIGFAYSLPKVLSIFFKEIQEDLGTSFSEIALIPSVMLAAVYGGGKPNSFLLQSPGLGRLGGWAPGGPEWGGGSPVGSLRLAAGGQGLYCGALGFVHIQVEASVETSRLCEVKASIVQLRGDHVGPRGRPPSSGRALLRPRGGYKSPRPRRLPRWDREPF